MVISIPVYVYQRSNMEQRLLSTDSGGILGIFSFRCCGDIGILIPATKMWSTCMLMRNDLTATWGFALVKWRNSTGTGIRSSCYVMEVKGSGAQTITNIFCSRKPWCLLRSDGFLSCHDQWLSTMGQHGCWDQGTWMNHVYPMIPMRWPSQNISATRFLEREDKDSGINKGSIFPQYYHRFSIFDKSDINKFIN